jgi:LysM repeat protein
MGVFSDGKTTLEISAENEEETISNKVAQYPIQTTNPANNNPITNHTQRESKGWTFDGKVYGANQAEVTARWNIMQAWQQAGTPLTYTGAIYHKNILIQELVKTYDEGGFKNAVKFNVTLTNVSFVVSSFVKATNTGFKKPSPPATPGVWITVKAGNTYWGWWQKYGTSINQLRAWNKWPDRRIPIGARARVK